jgi:Holliday junction DNA helicase RuvA
MFEYIKGKLISLSPAFAILENGGIGYFINISLNTYTALQSKDKEEVKLYIHEIIREDARSLYGFANKEERDTFRHLISVSGVGANTARLILSSLTPIDVMNSIEEGNVATFKSIKGIGLKTAQRIIVDLKDKIKPGDVDDLDLSIDGKKTTVLHNTIRSDALSALITLGYKQKEAEKALNKVLAAGDVPDDVAELVRRTLKILTN